MRMPRVSITAMMVGSVVIALDCAAIRSITSRDEAFTGSALACFALCLPMAHAIAIVVAAMIRRRGRGKPSSYGFMLGGGIALIGLIGSVVFDAVWVEDYGEWIGHLLSRAIGWDMASAELLVVLVTVGPVFLVLPQFLIAIACGLAFRRVAGRPQLQSADASAAPRRGRVAVAAVLILAAAPWVGFEIYYLREVDPLVARLAVSSRAIFDLERAKFPAVVGTPILPASWEGKAPSILPQGATVRIEGDGQPSLIQCYATSLGRQLGDQKFIDMRDVKITVLDGPGAGQVTSVPYYFLRPID